MKNNIIYYLKGAKPRAVTAEKGSYSIQSKDVTNSFIEKHDRFISEKKNGAVLLSIKNIFGKICGSYYQKNKPIWVRILAWIISPGPNKVYGGSILDIGCSSGSFLDNLPSTWRKIGVEINSEASKIGRKKGLIIHNSVFEKFVSNAKFDVIRASHVIEHSKNPEIFVKKISSLTVSGGKVLIYTPNAESISLKLFGRNWEGFYDDTHFHIFNSNSLENLFNKYNLYLLRRETYLMGYFISSLFRQLQLREKKMFKITFPILYIIFLPISILGKVFPSKLQGGGLYMEFIKTDKNK